MVTNKLNLGQELTRAGQQSNESLKLLTQEGHVVDTSEWLTIKRYAERYGVSQQVVVNWIGRGVIPADCTLELPELNHIRLVKNQSYK